MMTTGSNTGHGWVWQRPDGVKARCGGPPLCKTCVRDQRLQAEELRQFDAAVTGKRMRSDGSFFEGGN